MGTSVELSTLLTIMGGTFGITTAVIGVLVRMLLKSFREKTEEKLNGIQTDYKVRFENLQKELTDIAQDRKDCENRKDKNIYRLEALCNKLQEQWLDFQKAATSLEATRGRKLDTLFGILDRQKDEVKDIRENLHSYLQQFVVEVLGGRKTQSKE